MTAKSFDRLLKSSRLAMPAIGRDDDFLADRSIRIDRFDREQLEGKTKQGRAKAGGSGGQAMSLTRQLDKRTPMQRRFGHAAGARVGGPRATFDTRQRAVAKVQRPHMPRAELSRLRQKYGKRFRCAGFSG